jgi:hypothetical protein
MSVDSGAGASRPSPAPRTLWRLVLPGLAAAVIAGILSMHGFSAGHHAATPVSVTADSAIASMTAQHAGIAAPGDGMTASCPAGDCDDSMTMLCLVVLLTLTLLLSGRLARSWRWQPPWQAMAPHHPSCATTTGPAVSLIRLCISRT